jgi:hypothetical protein
MKNICVMLITFLFFSCGKNPQEAPSSFKHVDQVLWVVSNLDSVISQWNKLGFNQIINLGTANAMMKKSGTRVKIKIAKANLGGASVTWIQPLEGESVFTGFHKAYGDGIMSLVHRMDKKSEIRAECRRLARLGVKVREEIRIPTRKGELYFVLADTFEKGKYFLGYTTGWDDEQIIKSLSPGNQFDLRLNQYAFAIRDPRPVSGFWHSLGLPAIEVSSSALGNTRYYGKPADYQVELGWQKGSDIDYEWCIPVKPPTVYEDHIQKHGEGIHHLAYKVNEMDTVLQAFIAKGFTVSMGGTWGEPGKPGSGRYEYLDLENGGGVTMELLWDQK